MPKSYFVSLAKTMRKVEPQKMPPNMEHSLAFQFALQACFFRNKAARFVQTQVGRMQPDSTYFLYFLKQFGICGVLRFNSMVELSLFTVQNKKTNTYLISFGLTSNPTVVVVGVWFISKEHTKAVSNRIAPEFYAV